MRSATALVVLLATFAVTSCHVGPRQQSGRPDPPSSKQGQDQPAKATSRSCQNDWQCGMGHACVKANYQYMGRCARVVNEMGLPDYTRMPQTDSVMPKQPRSSDCTFDTDCPPLFRCDRASGACFKR